MFSEFIDNLLSKISKFLTFTRNSFIFDLPFIWIYDFAVKLFIPYQIPFRLWFSNANHDQQHKKFHFDIELIRSKNKMAQRIVINLLLMKTLIKFNKLLKLLYLYSPIFLYFQYFARFENFFCESYPMIFALILDKGKQNCSSHRIHFLLQHSQ